MWGDIQDIFLFGCPKTIDITGFFKKFCIATRTTLGALKLLGFKAPLLFLALIFPFCFPFRLGDRADVGIHPVCAGLLHLRCHMAVYIQGKGCGVMSQVALYGLDIVPSLQGSHRIAVAQVMQPCSRYADVTGNPLKVVVDCAR